MSYTERVTLNTQRLNPDHVFGPLVPVGRFDWERILSHCIFKPNTVKLVGFVMATYADLETGGRVYPGDKRISAVACMSIPTVKRTRKILEEAGLLHKVANGSSFGRAAKASEYQLTAPLVMAEQYRDDMNAGVWFEADRWETAELWNVAAMLDQVSTVTPDPEEQVSPVTPDNSSDFKEQVSLTKEQVSNSQEQGSLATRTGVTSEPPRTHRSTHIPMNQKINESSAASSPSASLEGRVRNFGADDESSNLTEEQERNRQAAALQKLMAEEKRQQSA